MVSQYTVDHVISLMDVPYAYIVSLTSRDQTGCVSVVDSDINVTTAQSLLNEQEEQQLPDGYVNTNGVGCSCHVMFRWELRHTPLGREYYVNHYTKSTQWEHPTRWAWLFFCNCYW